MPITRDVEQLWSLELPGAAIAPPVTWDGTVFVLCRDRRGASLVAVDLATGKRRAKKALPKCEPTPIWVWSNRVFLIEQEGRARGYQFMGSNFVPGRPLTVPGASCVLAHRNEFYVGATSGVHRCATGLRAPLWSAGGSDIRSLALLGDSVVSVGAVGEKVAVHLLDRSAGRGRLRLLLEGTATGLTLGGEEALISGHFESRSGRASHVFVGCQRGRKISMGEVSGLWSFDGPPAVYRDGLIGRSRGSWEWWTKGRGRVLATRKETPELFPRRAVPPTVLGEIVYFGTWAADLGNAEILWRLPLESVDFGAVPADRAVVVVSGPRLYAFGPRRGDR